MTSRFAPTRCDGTRSFALRVGAVGLLAFSAARAHHSFGSIYDQSQDVAYEGVVSEFRFVHPHPFLVVDVKSGNGPRRKLVAEMDNRFELEEIGITVATFRPGDVVRINGSPGRRDENTLYLWKLVRRSDGLEYRQVGGTPYLRKAPISP